MISRIFLAAGLFASIAFGQNAVNQTEGPVPSAWVRLLYYNGSSQLQYVCYSPSMAPTTTYTIGGTPGLTNIVVLTNVGTVNLAATAQWWVGQTITVAGSTTAALNGNYVLSAVSGSTGTIATAGVSDATYNNAAMVITTTQPVLNAARWAIRILTYASSNLATTYWAQTSLPNGVNTGLACSARASY